MKIELTIKTSYLLTWGVWEGIRELVQNGKDAEVEFSAPMTISHLGETLRIENVGCTLPHEALLLGHTTKVGRTDMAGKYGEGLKLGILALVRAGHAVKVRSGDEVWTPLIQHSEKFDADVLTFDISKGREPKSRVRVEIEGISAEEWKKMKLCFLFLNKTDKNSVETAYGTLLLDPERAGRVYVKGIFVESEPKLSYGYDLRDGEVDRDRKLVARWDLNYRTRLIWNESVAKRPDLLDPFYALLNDQKADVEGVDQYSAGNLSDTVKKATAEKFKAQFGESAVPVANFAESKEVEHLGRKGVVVPRSLAAVLAAVVGDFSKVKEGLLSETVRKYGYHELSQEQKDNLESAIRLLKDGAQVEVENDLDVVDFRSDTLEGTFQGGKIQVALRMISDKVKTLEVLLHEAAHRQGTDGEKSHVATVEEYWARVTRYLWK